MILKKISISSSSVSCN